MVDHRTIKVDNILTTLESKQKLRDLGELLRDVYGNDGSSMLDRLLSQLFSIKNTREQSLKKSRSILTEIMENNVEDDISTFQHVRTDAGLHTDTT